MKLSFSLLALSAITTGSIAAIGLSSCSGVYYSSSYRILTKNNTGIEYNKLPFAQYTINNIMAGTKEYNDGNYIVIIDSQSDPKQLLNSNNDDQIFSVFHDDHNLKVKISELLIYQDTLPVSQESVDKMLPGLKDFNDKWNPNFFLTPSDQPPSKDNWDWTDPHKSGSENPISNVNANVVLNPFLRYSSNDNVKKEYQGKYIRNDESAQNYRKLIVEILELNIPLFKDGKSSSTLSKENISYIQPIVFLYKFNAATNRVEAAAFQYDGNINLVIGNLKTFYSK